MAKVIPVGQPVNDAERAAIAHLRDRLPDSYTLLTLPRFHVQQEVDNFRGTENRNERRQAAQAAVHTGIQG